MTARKKNPMSRAEAGRRGGLTSAHRLGPEGMAAIGARGGEVTLARHGRVHMLRMSDRRWRQQAEKRPC